MQSPQFIGEPPGRIAPVDELVNTLEFEPMAQRSLGNAVFAEIAGGNRDMFGRITFRPRMMVNTTKPDLTVEMFGQTLFAPIVVGPVAEQKRFHAEGELATARGAAAAKAVMVVADRSSYPVEQIAAEAKGGFWYQVYPDADVEAARGRVQKAVGAGAKAVCLTLGVAGTAQTGWDWATIDKFRQGMKVPLLLKGIMSPEEAQAAAAKGVQGIVVSNYVGSGNNGLASPIEVLPRIADAVGGRMPILIDGSFRRGSDVLMAIALGARAVMVARPAMWGLAAYGAPGVERVVELLQTETGRDMVMCGKQNIKSVDKAVVKVHRF